MVEDGHDGSNADTIAATDPTEVAKTVNARPGRLPPSPTGGGPATVGARYRSGELLGQGGMGEVVLAHDEHIGREVAIKRIRAERLGSEAVARFLREARIQARLEHPTVVPVHDLGSDAEGRPYFVMKRLTGTVMSELIRAMPEDPVAARRRLLRAFVEVCLAIEFAHARGIIHRDLKPANIMLGDFGEVYVLDWGIARTTTEPDDSGTVVRPSQVDLKLDTGDTELGTILGTPAYMAPEQLGGDHAGPPADVYALGCILYEILAGRALHREARTNDAAERDARPSQVVAETPPELDALCVSATRTDRTARPTARGLGDGVQAYLDGDRDVVFRRELAQAQIAIARAAIARGDDERDRQIAMHAAGRALALDPTANEAAELITLLVLRPPARTPAAVDATLDARDVETGRTQGRLAALTMIGYVAFVPFMLWTGMREPWFVVAFAGLALASSLQVYAMTRKDRIFGWRIYANACINAVLIGLVCRMVGPFIIAPTLVLTTVVGYAAHPRFGRIGIVAAILAAGVMVPWALELVGVLSPTYAFIDGSIVLRSPVMVFASVPVQLAFALLLVVLLAVVALLSRAMAVRQREANLRVELQAWHLRQLVAAPA